jgi:RNA polymerase sigma-70 factor (ECF subfamily)
MDYESDEMLVSAFAENGDGRALEALFRRNLGRVYSLSRRYFPIREDAEEASSEAFLRAFRALSAGQFRWEASFRTWLLRIAANVCLERLRQPRLPTLSLWDVPEDLPANSNGASKSDLWEAIGRLDDDHRLVLTLCDLEGYDAKEAAEIIGRSLTATKSLHYRARRALRDELENSS